MNAWDSATPASLELNLSHTGGDYTLIMRLERYGDQKYIQQGPFPVAFDFEKLWELAGDAHGYGAALSAMIFQGDIKSKFEALCAAALSTTRYIRIRLVVPRDLHGLRWETLHGVESGSPIALDHRLLLSRYLSSEDNTLLKLRPKRHMRVLIAVAAPNDIHRYNLVPIDADAEIARLRSCLAGSLSSRSIEASWTNLSNALREDSGYDILYLVAHGTVVDGNPWLFLVNEQGKTDRKKGSELSRLIRSLDNECRPRLIILASCESASDGYVDAMAATGPLLAHAGVPAVVSMQGSISTATNAILTTVLFRELLRDGAIDRAVHQARIAVASQPDWWVPVLYSQLLKGTIWQEEVVNSQEEWSISDDSSGVDIDSIVSLPDPMLQMQIQKYFGRIYGISDDMSLPLLRERAVSLSQLIIPTHIVHPQDRINVESPDDEDSKERQNIYRNWLDLLGTDFADLAATLTPTASDKRPQVYRVISGDPGLGKTSLARYITLKLAALWKHDPKTAHAKRLPVPFLLDARMLPNPLPKDIRGAILDCMGKTYSYSLDADGSTFLNIGRSIFAHMWRTEPILLIIDGVDAIQPPSMQTQFARSLEQAASTRLDSCSILITTRSSLVEQQNWYLPFYVCRMEGLDQDKREALLQKLAKALANADISPYYLLNEYKKLIQRSPRLASTPLLVTLLASVVTQDSDQSEIDQVRLLRQYIDLSIQRACEQSGVDCTQDKRRGLIEKLEMFAYQLHITNKRLATRNEVEAYWQTRLESEESEEFSLAKSSCLLELDKENQCKFSHDTFQDFLAASYVVHQRAEAQILFKNSEGVSRYFYDQWRETALYCFSLLDGLRQQQFFENWLRIPDSDPALLEDHAVAYDIATDMLLGDRQFAITDRRRYAEAILSSARKIVKSTSLTPNVPSSDVRVTCGRILAKFAHASVSEQGQLSDLETDSRLGVLSLAPLWVDIEGEEYELGLTESEKIALIDKFHQAYGQDSAQSKAEIERLEQLTLRKVRTPGFKMAAYPVTNRQYELFLRENGVAWWDPDAHLWWNGIELSERNSLVQRLAQPLSWRDDRLGQHRPNHPVVGVTWFAARAFCRWLTYKYASAGQLYRLPTADEWEIAARGKERRLFPWGNTNPTRQHANHTDEHTYFDGTTAVGCFPVGSTPNGLYDMAGNVWEWTVSQFPADNHPQIHMTIRGGSRYDWPVYLHSAYKAGERVTHASRNIGFRVVQVSSAINTLLQGAHLIVLLSYEIENNHSGFIDIEYRHKQGSQLIRQRLKLNQFHMQAPPLISSPRGVELTAVFTNGEITKVHYPS